MPLCTAAVTALLTHWSNCSLSLTSRNEVQSMSCHSFTIWVTVINTQLHGDVIKWKHFPRYWPFLRGIHRSPVNSPHKGQWRGALMFSLICVWINGWVNNGEAGDLRRHRAHYDVTVMLSLWSFHLPQPRLRQSWGILHSCRRHPSPMPETADRWVSARKT